MASPPHRAEDVRKARTRAVPGQETACLGQAGDAEYPEEPATELHLRFDIQQYCAVNNRIRRPEFFNFREILTAS